MWSEQRKKATRRVKEMHTKQSYSSVVLPPGFQTAHDTTHCFIRLTDPTEHQALEGNVPRKIDNILIPSPRARARNQLS